MDLEEPPRSFFNIGLIIQLIPFYIIISILLFLTYELTPKKPSVIKDSKTETEVSDSDDEGEIRLDGVNRNDTLLSGTFYLKTVSIRSGKGWKLRYFRLKPAELSFFKDEGDDAKWCGSIFINSHTTIEKLKPAQCFNKHHGLLIKTDSNSVMVHYITAAELDKWASMIAKVIDACIEKTSITESVSMDNQIAVPVSEDNKKKSSTFRRIVNAGNNMLYRKESESTEDGITNRPKSRSITPLKMEGKSLSRVESKEEDIIQITARRSSSSISLVTDDTSQGSLTRINTEDTDDITVNTAPESTTARRKRMSMFSGMFSHSDSTQSSPDLAGISRQTSVGPMGGDDNEKYKKFLNGSEKIITSSLVVKKNPIGIPKFRQLILTNAPRLFYIDPKDLSIKGEVEWCHDMDNRVEKMNDSTFKIETDTRSYKFSDSVNGAPYWIDQITSVCTKVNGLQILEQGTSYRDRTSSRSETPPKKSLWGAALSRTTTPTQQAKAAAAVTTPTPAPWAQVPLRRTTPKDKETSVPSPPVVPKVALNPVSKTPQTKNISPSKKPNMSTYKLSEESQSFKTPQTISGYNDIVPASI